MICRSSTLLLIIALTTTSSCALLPSAPGTDWTYLRPPTPDDLAIVPPGGVWCDSAEKAIFMATTGFFTDGCSSSGLTASSYRVVSIEHIAQNDVRTWVVKAMNSQGTPVWIPLPDHNWA